MYSQCIFPQFTLVFIYRSILCDIITMSFIIRSSFILLVDLPVKGSARFAGKL